MKGKQNVYAVILAGGCGERLWPLSTPENPKQFLDIFGGRSLIRQAAERVKGLVPPENVLVITSAAFVKRTRTELPMVPAENIIGEPCRRNTAAAVALAVREATRRGGDEAVCCILTADHLIRPAGKFRATLSEAAKLAENTDSIVTIGIKPTCPATGFGYIELTNCRFVEKPDAKTAAKYLKSGMYFWNSGMFIFKASVMREELSRYLPETAALAEARNWKRLYADLKPISIDYAVMERTSRIRMIPAAFDWDDIGSFEAISKRLGWDMAKILKYARERMKALALTLAVAFVTMAQATEKVNVFIGTAGLGHVTPAATVPFGMVQAGPDTSPDDRGYRGGWERCAGYQNTDRYIYRFSQTHISGTGVSSCGDFGIFPFVKDPKKGAEYCAKKIVKSECAEPGYYAVHLANGVAAEMTASPHAAAYRFRYPEKSAMKLLVDLDWGANKLNLDKNDHWGSCFGRRALASTLAVESPTLVTGGHKMVSWNPYEVYFAMEFSRPIVTNRVVLAAGNGRGEIRVFEFAGEGLLEVRMGLSCTSVAAAKRNLAAEMPKFDFTGCLAAAKAKWARVFARVKLDEKTPKDIRDSFYAALYRTHFQPNDIGDVGTCRYSTLSLWDTFRAAHPLYTIVAPERVDGFVCSMLDQFKRTGYLPIWGLWGTDNHCMIGHHAVPVIVDAYLKGFRGFDARLALAAVNGSLTSRHRACCDGTWGLMKEDWEAYDKYGYLPFDMMSESYLGKKVIGESAARTLECAYDDACAAKLAGALGIVNMQKFFECRSGYWKNLFDPSVGFIRGKDSKGRWREPFDPYALGGGPWTDNDFCEGNSWQYTWHVMQDPEGLIAAFGGREKFLKKLTELFEQGPHEYKDRPTGDVTGLIGQYAHGNEPSHHVIYFFTIAGRPDLAGKYVKKVFETQYFAKTDGLCGNDDCGQMAAWYVFSALGFYPFDPCGGEYVIGAPQVPGAELAMPGGRRLVLRVTGKGPSVKKVSLNGIEMKDFKLRHSDLINGGELVYEMR